MNVRNRFSDTLLLEANYSGERLIALIRVTIHSLIGLIPFILYFVFEDNRPEVIISLAIALSACIIAIFSYWLIRKQIHVNAVGWVLTALDISVVSLVLFLVAIYSNPLIATNSLVIWQIYGVLIFSTTLRLNPQITLFAGLLAIAQYFLLIVFFVYRFDLSDLVKESIEYGAFSWYIQVARIIILILFTLVAYSFVARARKLVIYSGTDSLTGLKNRAYFEHVFPAEVAKSCKSKRPLSFVFMDFDHFKNVNDKFGHAVGDLALQAVADVLQRFTERSSQVARWGGEEFVIFYPNHTKEEVLNIIVQIRKELSQGVEVRPNLILNLKLCAGIVECPAESEDPISIITLADDRMLQAKSNGRDQVVWQEKSS